jgi:hypothetical protein
MTADEWADSDLSDLTDLEDDVDQLADDDEDASASYRAAPARKPKAAAAPTKSLLRPPRTSQYSAESLYRALLLELRARSQLTARNRPGQRGRDRSRPGIPARCAVPRSRASCGC